MDSLPRSGTFNKYGAVLVVPGEIFIFIFPWQGVRYPTFPPKCVNSVRTWQILSHELGNRNRYDTPAAGGHSRPSWVVCGADETCHRLALSQLTALTKVFPCLRRRFKPTLAPMWSLRTAGQHESTSHWCSAPIHHGCLDGFRVLVHWAPTWEQSRVLWAFSATCDYCNTVRASSMHPAKFSNDCYRIRTLEYCHWKCIQKYIKNIQENFDSLTHILCNYWCASNDSTLMF
jgi:hypothetical protein